MNTLNRRIKKRHGDYSHKIAFSLAVVNCLSVTRGTWETQIQFRPFLTTSYVQQRPAMDVQNMANMQWHCLDFCPNIPWPLVRGFPRQKKCFPLCHLQMTRTFPLNIYQFLYTVAFYGERASLLLSLHVTFVTVYFCAMSPSPCHVFSMLKHPSLFCHL